ncbi:MAG: calcium/sodium antiporter [Candidatus Omnitrophica bacterium]|nr:calcium/sodium antiporter [Candidatus Omnitrophota bacterium]MDD5430296.1 calcium/sodium antiporter [Candidatus Omnitrophota bacterium]
MEVISNFIIFFVGLLILIFSSGWMIQASVKVSYLFRLSPLFIGLILVAFGTSVPEAGVGIVAAIRNYRGVALGNIIGSNIANIGLILGICALFRPLGVNKSIFKREMPMMLASVLLLFILSADLCISRIDGIILLAGFVAFCIIAYTGGKKSFDTSEIDNFKLKSFLKKSASTPLVLIIILLSLLGVFWGANLMVNSGVLLAAAFGISPWVVGLTVFAIGTSLPELSASLTAAFKKVPSISVGNIVGSNIFNILFILGVVALVRPITISAEIFSLELPVLLIYSLAILVVMRTGFKITRWEGGALLLGYVGFLAALFLKR